MKIIEIKDFKGVFSNCDKEDLAPEYLTVCKNLIPKNGRLIKSFGFGIKLDSALAEVIKNFITYIHSKWSGDELYVAVRVNGSYSMGLYAWNGAAWVGMSTLDNFTLYGAYYHKIAKNPILQEGEVLRILPGNVGEAGGYEAKGVWIGYLDRKIFDGFYTISAGFYGYSTNIERPTLTITQQWLGDADSIFKAADIYYYKFSFVYDGAQESLLSSYYRWEVGADYRANVLKFQITKSTFNKRITAIKVYRSTNEESNYRHIHTVDLLRKNDVSQSSGTLIIGSKYRIENNSGGADFTNVGATYNNVWTEFIATGTTPTSWGTGSLIRMPSDFYGDINGGNSGRRWIYVPALTTHDFDADNGGDGYDKYQIIIDVNGTPDNIEIANQYGNGTGNTLFNIEDGESDIVTHYVDEDWKLQGKLDAGEWQDLEQDSDGCYAGWRFIFVNKDLSGDDVKESYIVWREGSNRLFRKISDYHEERAVEFSDPILTYYGNQAWRIFLTNKGSFVIEDGASVWILFLDRSFIGGEEYYLAGEKSIKVNGKFAKIILERLWQGNIVLDPGGENEEHNDWISYSEIGQFDVNPVSNVERVIDREGGEITGLAEVFGNPVILKPMAIIVFNAKYFPDEPEKWSIMESIHQIGNIAPEGAISVLDNLYVISYNGIYRLSPSNLSDSDSVPTEKLKISEPIQDVFDALSLVQKQGIISEYDAKNGEIIFNFPST